jgi:hypothetical protein
MASPPLHVLLSKKQEKLLYDLSRRAEVPARMKNRVNSDLAPIRITLALVKSSAIKLQHFSWLFLKK